MINVGKMVHTSTELKVALSLACGGALAAILVAGSAQSAHTSYPAVHAGSITSATSADGNAMPDTSTEGH